MRKLIFLFGCCFLLTAALFLSAENPRYEAARKRTEEQNHKEALALYWELLNTLPDASTPENEKMLSRCWTGAMQAVSALNLPTEYDRFFRLAAKRYPHNIRLLTSMANTAFPAYGTMIGTEFHRGGLRSGTGRPADASERDRAEMLSLLAAAVPYAEKSPRKGEFYEAMMAVLLRDRADSWQGWRLQHKTDLKQMPAYERSGMPSARPPVRPDGSPVLYDVPDSFESAKNDGERLRFAYEQALKTDRRRESRILFADFLARQFDFRYAPAPVSSRYLLSEQSRNVLKNLSDAETITELRNGERRFTLPPAFRYIDLYREAGTENALTRLAEIYMARTQYEKAARIYREILKLNPKSAGAKNQLSQITGNWIRLEPMRVQPAGATPELNLTYRNTAKVHLTISEVDAEQVLRLTLKRLGAPGDDPAQVLQPYDFLSAAGKDSAYAECIGRVIRTLEKTLPVPPGHTDRETAIALPVLPPGVYRILVRAEHGNSESMILWVTEYSLSTKSSSGGVLFFLNDAVSGAPVPKREITVYDFRRHYARTPEEAKRYGKVRTETVQLSFRTEPDGTFFMPEKKERGMMLAVAVINGKYAVYCNPVRPAGNYFQNERNHTVFLTDRPIYRPGDPVEFTAYPRTVSYLDVKDPVPKTLTVRISSPRGQSLYRQELPVNPETGGASGVFHLPADADLGSYSIYVQDRFYGGRSFLVEEYQKPEYQLILTSAGKSPRPSDPLEIRCAARYYFGSPLVRGKIRYQVFRSERFFVSPFPLPFDWLYRGVRTPIGRERLLVAQGTGLTDANGEFLIRLNPEIRKDGKEKRNEIYRVEAEVEDSTKRPVSAAIDLAVSEIPFRIFLSPMETFFRTGTSGSVELQVLSAAGSPIRGAGILKLFPAGLDRSGRWIRSGGALFSIPFETDGKSAVPFRFSVAKSGVYELFAEFHSGGHSETVSVPMRFAGSVNGNAPYAAAPLALFPDRRSYRPGETARILVASEKAGATVYFFVDSSAAPQVRKLDGYSTIFEVPVTKAQMPNFYAEAFAVFDGRAHSARHEIPVPPESRKLHAEVSFPVGETVPRATVPLTIRITDSLTGKPVVGSVTAAVYDKALDALCGPSSAFDTDILSAFWSWKRFCYTDYSSTLNNMMRPFSEGARMEPVFPVFLPGAGIFSGFAKNRNGIRTRESMRGELADAAEVPAALPENAAGTPEIRSEFPDRILWIGQKSTDSNGRLTLDVSFPDSLTAWKVRVWTVTRNASAGQGETEILVTKDFLVRLSAPRFLVAGDRSEVVAVVQNRSEKAVRTEVLLKSLNDGLSIHGFSRKHVRIEPGASESVSFRVEAGSSADEAVLRLSAGDGKNGDAIQIKLPVLPRGFAKTVPFSGRIEKDTVNIPLYLPAERRAGSESLTLTLSPGVAVSMVRLLPILSSPDLSNTFGTANAFFPALHAEAAFRTLNIRPESMFARFRADDPLVRDYLDGRTPPSDPVEFERMIVRSIRMLCSSVNADGGWGWFSGSQESSWPDTTAVAFESLSRAGKAGYKLPDGLLDRARIWLEKYAASRAESIGRKKSAPDHADALVLRVLSDHAVRMRPLEALVYEKRESLAPYGLAQLGLSLPPGRERTTVIRNLEQFLVVNRGNETAYLMVPPSFGFHWYGNDTETQAAYLRLLLRDNPKNPLCARVAKYLTANIGNAPSRNSVRALGAAVIALSEYLIQSGETVPGVEFEAVFDKTPIKKWTITPGNLWSSDFRVTLPPDLLTEGAHTLHLRATGHGAVYYNVELSYFSKEKAVAPSGSEMTVVRNYYRLIPKTSPHPLPSGGKGDGERFLRVPVSTETPFRPGDLLEVELIGNASNDYDYVELKDSIPAGFEYVSPVSGFVYGGTHHPRYGSHYLQYRSRGPVFFFRSFSRERNVVSYRLRARFTGNFLALPAQGQGIYAPTLKCNSPQENFLIREE